MTITTMDLPVSAVSLVEYWDHVHVHVQAILHNPLDATLCGDTQDGVCVVSTRFRFSVKWDDLNAD